MNPSSGTIRGRGTVSDGRARVRVWLYMGALVASQHRPGTRSFCQRPLAAGKPKKLVLTAFTCRLLTVLSGMVQTLSALEPPRN